jgi:hypothetical protein
MGRGEAHTGLWWGNQKEEIWKGLGGSSRSEIRGMDWIYLAQVRDRWRALVIAVMNVRVP